MVFGKILKNPFKILESSIDLKFEGIYHRLSSYEQNLQPNITAIVNKSIMSIKDSIIEALEEENQNLWKKVNELEEKLMPVEMSRNKLDQYNRQNNVEMQGISASVSDDSLKDKVIDIFKLANISIDKSDIEDCHTLGKLECSCSFEKSLIFISQQLTNILGGWKKTCLAAN